MSRLKIRAVVLAAGHGRRLRPLTETLPKPLLPVLGLPVAGRTLSQVAAAGCEAAAMNLHHHGDMVRRGIGDTWGDLPVSYSEEPKLLGTLGALGPLRDFLRQADLVVVVNGDSLCQWPLKRLIRRHRKGGAEATLLVSRLADPEPYGGGIGVDGKGRVTSFRRTGDPQAPATASDERRRVFMGAHVFSPGLIPDLGGGPADFVSDLYQPLLDAGKVLRVLETTSRWHDLGTPSRYLRGVLDWAKGSHPYGRSWRSPGSSVGASARIRASVLEPETRIAEGCELERTLVLPGATLAEGCRIGDSIVGFGVTLRAGTAVEGRLMSRATSMSTPMGGDSVVGGIVYAPIHRT